jgi:3-dehydroquinate dehydratase/shikimate dehydrogenase
MICVTVTPTSRKLAKVDLLNAARFGDVIELSLDHLAREPDVKDLITGIDKPIIVSCRRKADGGKWEGTEEQRIALLRQAIVAGPSYIELDLETAPSIPRFGKVQRVISFTRLDRPEHDIDRIFDEAASANADIVKFTWPTPTIDDTWPLLVAVSQKRRLPIVGMGLGKAELTFSLLGQKYGSPWVYAALEQGMESHPGQATVFDLIETYAIREIDKKTTFVAVAGFGETQTKTIRIFNAAFRRLQMPVRCLPLQVGELKQLRKMLDSLKIRAIVASGQLASELAPLADKIDEQDAKTGYVDLLLNKSDSWHGYNALWRSGVKALESALAASGDGKSKLEKLNVMVVGAGGCASALTYAIAQRKGLVSVCAQNDKQAQRMANDFGCRFVPYQNMYNTLVDVIVLADPNLRCGVHQGCINPSLFKAGVTVLDVTNPPLEHELAAEAKLRGGKVIDSKAIYLEVVRAQFKAIAGQDLPAGAIDEGLGE